MNAPTLSEQHTQASFRLGDTILEYRIEPTGGTVELSCRPDDPTLTPAQKREYLDTPEILALPSHWGRFRATRPDSMVQLHLRECDLPGGHIAGRSFRNSPATGALRFESQSHRQADDGLTLIETVLSAPAGYRAVHRVVYQEGDPFFRVSCEFINTSDHDWTLELLSSAALTGMTQFDSAEATERMFVHRFRSNWSSEGRHEVRSLEALHLEPCWAPFTPALERFGQIGSMPVREWFPWIGVEDRKAGVMWGMMLGIASSWQIELYRRGDELAFSGGLADALMGHWWKTVRPGESFRSPEAVLATVVGGVDELAHALTASHERALEQQPEREQSLPIVFNEWCTHWGKPTDVNLRAIADRLQGLGVDYLVIDDGWAERRGDGAQQNGDWIVNKTAFPEGLVGTAQYIRDRGMVPGLWFEFEVCNGDSKAFQMTEHHLHRHGRTLQVGNRRFWDFRDPWVMQYLKERVIDRLGGDGFGYLKVDYNDSIGVGAEGAESPGEALRQHIEQVEAFFARMREELPELVIECCSSGGYRLVNGLLRHCAMGSFSDAHEGREIPLIAANLHRLILPRQSQVWAVLREHDTPQRLYFSLAATLLGRMCISGDMARLPEASTRIVREAIDFYRRSAKVIRSGRSRVLRNLNESMRHPVGWQAVSREGADGQSLLVVMHLWGGPPKASIRVPLPPGPWKVETALGQASHQCTPNELIVHWPSPGDSGSAWLLQKTHGRA